MVERQDQSCIYIYFFNDIEGPGQKTQDHKKSEKKVQSGAKEEPDRARKIRLSKEDYKIRKINKLYKSARIYTSKLDDMVSAIHFRG